MVRQPGMVGNQQPGGRPRHVGSAVYPASAPHRVPPWTESRPLNIFSFPPLALLCLQVMASQRCSAFRGLAFQARGHENGGVKHDFLWRSGLFLAFGSVGFTACFTHLFGAALTRFWEHQHGAKGVLLLFKHTGFGSFFSISLFSGVPDLASYPCHGGLGSGSASINHPWRVMALHTDVLGPVGGKGLRLRWNGGMRKEATEWWRTCSMSAWVQLGGGTWRVIQSREKEDTLGSSVAMRAVIRFRNRNTVMAMDYIDSIW